MATDQGLMGSFPEIDNSFGLWDKYTFLTTSYYTIEIFFPNMIV